MPLPEDLGEIISSGNLQITSGQPKNDNFRAAIKDVSIFKVNTEPSRKDITKVFKEGIQNIQEKLKTICIVTNSTELNCDLKI